MQFQYNYGGSSGVRNDARNTEIGFAPDLLRPPTYFRGRLVKALPFREAISALHDVVVSDLRFKPKDREEYKVWAEQQTEAELAQVMAEAGAVQGRIDELRKELDVLRAQSDKRMAPFYKARKKYFDYLYKRDYDAWFVLDPVITVHPDEIFFECFSQDEATYGRLGASHEVFERIEELAHGTTNIDYSAALYDEFQKIRTYKNTEFLVDPSGFEVKTTGEQDYKEVKIDLPDSWVRGFLQVSSAMTLPGVRFRLHPMDLYNFCWVLRRRRELKGPRSMRYILEPGRPVRVVFEPWNVEVVCARSIYEGPRAEEIRVWGRRRLHVLERLIQIARSFTVILLGTGLPSFYVADLGAMSFTLGLSGWTANDWSRAGNFDLMAPRAETDEDTRARVFAELQKVWLATPEELGRRLDLDPGLVRGALGVYVQAGRVMFDLDKNVYRLRELSREPLPMDRLRFANERESAADALLCADAVRLKAPESGADGVLLRGTVRKDNRNFETELFIDRDQRLTRAQCNCNFYTQNKLYRGPCEHMLALRLQFARETTPVVKA